MEPHSLDRDLVDRSRASIWNARFIRSICYSHVAASTSRRCCLSIPGEMLTCHMPLTTQHHTRLASGVIHADQKLTVSDAANTVPTSYLL